MAIYLTCPECKAKLTLTAADASRPIICDACGRILRASQPDPAGEFSLLEQPPAMEDLTPEERLEEEQFFGQRPALNWRERSMLLAVLVLLLTMLIEPMLQQMVANAASEPHPSPSTRSAG